MLFQAKQQQALNFPRKNLKIQIFTQEIQMDIENIDWAF